LSVKQTFCVAIDAIDARISEFWVNRDGYESVMSAVDLDGYADHAQLGARAAQGG
jgi:hypothetical protein